MKILVVEDDDNSRVYLERALKAQGYIVESATNGVLALEKALQSPPDIIISDIMMPEMDGFALCGQVKADEQLQHIPFIFYTATYTEKKDEELAIALGASRFILKPIEMEEFFKIIIEVIEELKEKKLPVPKKILLEKDKIDEMYSGTIERKLEKKITQLQQEITERKQADEALRESEERFRTIFDSINDAVFIHDMETGAILDVNSTMCKMYGYSREEVDQLDIQAVSSGEVPYTQQDALEWNKKAAMGDAQVFEWMAKHKSGHLFWVEVNMKKAVIGLRERLLVVVRDITERKQAEAELKKLNEELEQRVNERTAELEENTDDLERMVKAFTGRELRMIELKEQIAELEKNAEHDKKAGDKTT